MPRDEDSGFDETQSSLPVPALPGGGTFMGVTWRWIQDGRHLQLILGDQTVHAKIDRLGSVVSHAVVGRWANPDEMVRTILRYHPDYSPLAGRRRPPNVS